MHHESVALRAAEWTSVKCYRRGSITHVIFHFLRGWGGVVLAIMQVQCGHCGRMFTAPAVQAGAVVPCPACGALNTMQPLPAREPGPGRVPAAGPAPEARAGRHHAEDLEEEQIRRVFEPFPRPVMLLFALLLVVLLSAPFWLEYLMGQSKRLPVLVLDEEAPARSPLSATNTPLAAAPTSELAGPRSFDAYADIHLATPRDVLQQRFKLHLKNTPGMRPEIYEASDDPNFERLTAYFYNNELKEFVLVQHSQPTTPLMIVRELRQQFGEPTDWAEPSSQKPSGAANLPATIGTTGESGDRLAERLRAFPYQQELVWDDGQHRLTATIYYTAKEPVNCVSILKTHVVDSAWIDAQPRLLSPVRAHAELPPAPSPATNPASKPPLRVFP